MTKKSSPATFEESFSRLEKILERMNSGEATLDESLKLYEEADGLITNCHKRLTEAEQKIEKLVKSREGELQVDASGTPQTEDFNA